MWYKECPICSKELIINEIANHSKCSNGCYSKTGGYGTTTETVFNKSFIFEYVDSSETWKKIEAELNTEIAYWKEDDRYLLEILSR